ncbi:hypothetical protein COB64_02200 [Candidatus Wolfebacteria bacterium]|nr:MAG: hypothetical protein COB64_02200 [Candidatus Wolfebacteria bacterium]
MNLQKNALWSAIVLFVVGIIVGYVVGFNKGEKSAIADIQAQQQAVTDQAVEEAAQDINPFEIENPLEGIEANPFDEAKDILNPFNE